MKKLLSIICTLAIVLGVVLVPGMVSASAATTATFLDFNVTKTTMTDAGDGVYYVTGGWKDHYIFTDFEMQAGKTYNITMNVGIDHYSGGVRLEAATADFKCKNRTNIPYAKGNKVMDNIILSHTFNADDMIDGDYKYVAFNINCAEGSTTKNGVKNIRICEVPSNEGYANIRATYELGNWGVDSTGTWAFIGSAYYGWQNGQYDVEISPDKYYKIDYEYKGKSSRDGGRALGWSTTADGALSSGGSAIGATYVALPDQGVVVSEYKAYSQIVSGAALGATETNKYLTICGQNVLGAITHIRNVKVSELASAPFFTKFKGVTATYVETTESGNEYAYGIPANDTFGAGWGSDHYMTSEYVLEPNSTYIITYDWKGHNYSEPIWFTIMDEAGSNYKYRELLANISSKNAYVRQGSVLRTGSNVDDTYKYFGMMVKDYGTDPYLVKNVNITKVDEAALTTLLPSATRGNAFVAYDDVDGAYFWERGWNGNGSFTFDYVINPEDTYKISFHFKGANALGHAGDNEANYWALRTNTSTGKAGYTAGVGTKIDTIPAKDQSWGYFAYDFTFKGSDIGATTDSPYLVLQQGGYYATCYFKDIQIVNLSKTPADYSAVNAAIDAAGKLNKGNYVDFTAVDNAIAAVVEGKMAIDQVVVDGYAKAINDAVAALELKKADYSAVNDAVAEAQRIDSALYTNYAAVEDAVDAVVPGLDITKQAEVDAMAKAINDAIAALQYKPADYTDVEDAIADAELLDKNLYKDFTAVDNAVNAVVKDKNITEQDAVDAMAAAINNAIANLEFKDADYTAVQNAIAAANAIDADLYTNFIAVTAAIDAVDYTKNITEQAEVDAYAEAIYAAIEALEYKAADYSAVEEATAKAVALRPDADLYVNFQAVEDAVANVELGKNVTEQAEVDAMAKAINDALAALQYKPADYTSVEDAIAEAEKLNPEVYTNYQAVQDAIDAVEYGLDITKQSQVDAYAGAILAAIEDLEYSGANYDKVTAAIEAANKFDGELYTNWADVDAAIKAVVYGLDVTKQAEVDAMADAINNAVAALKLKAADYTAVEQVIADSETFDATLYSNWADVEAAINDVVYGLDITKQAQVDAYAQAISDAINALKFKGADYAKVEAAIEAAEAINADLYDNYSVVEVAVKAVVYGLDITKQAEVDAMAKAINDAIAVLQYKVADYTAVQNAIDAANALVKDNYVSFDAVDAAIAAVDYTKNITEQDEVDAMAEAINAAVAALELKKADYSAVNDAVAEAQRLDSALYTNYAAVEDAVDAVVPGLHITKQAEVDAMAKAINDAIAALQYKPANYEAVEAAKVAASALAADLYTNFDAVTAAIEAVDYNKNITEQAEVDAMAKAINDAIAALQYKAADYAKVEAAKAAANALTKEIYVDFTAVDKAIADVVYGLDITSQNVVDGYADAINAAVAALELKAADYTAVEEAIAAADAVENKEQYSNWADVEAAINAVVYDLDITKQAEVNAYAQAIYAAIDALALNGANYAEVNEAIAAANALNKANYVDFSAVDAAVAAVVPGLDFTKQAEVDAWADAIYAAIDALAYVDGFIEENGQLYYCENGAKALDKGVIVVGGKYYYIGFHGDVIGEGVHWINDKNLNGLTDPNGEALKAGLYTINADNTIKLLAGLVEEGGKLYYYENGQIATNKGLVLVGGKYYFIGSEGYALGEGVHWINDKNLNGLTDPNGEALKAGLYTVNADLTVKILAGLVEEGGKLYYYENGQVAADKGLVLVGGNYYFIGADGYALGEGVHWINDKNLNGLKTPGEQALKAGLYVVNADYTVKILEGIVEEGGKLYYYENGLKTAKGLVFEGGKYYFIGADCYALGEGVHWINEKNLNGLKDPNGEDLKVGLYTVNADCTVKVLAGIVEEEGKLYYYENGVKVAKGLVYDETTDNYYCFGINYYAIGEGEYFFNEIKLNGQKDRNGADLEAGFYTVNADCTVVIA